jgi:hypothetical protein
MYFNKKNSVPALSLSWDQAPRSWMIPNHQSRTFIANADGMLHFPVGRAWVTLTRKHSLTEHSATWPDAADDLFLDARNSLRIRAGQVLVVEPWSAVREADLQVLWEPMMPPKLGTKRPLHISLKFNAMSALTAACQRWIFTKFLRDS